MSNFTLTGKVIHVGETRSGTGSSGEWKDTEFVIEYQSGEYTRKAVFSAGTKSSDYAAKLKVGDTVTVSFSLSANESKGRYFGKNQAFKIEAQGGEVSNQQSQSNNTSFQNNNTEDDGLPF